MDSALTIASNYSIKGGDSLHKQVDDDYVVCVKDLPLDDKPREKLNKYGPSTLDLTELLAVLLGTGTKREEVMSMANRIAREYGEKAVTSETDPIRMAEALEIPPTKAAKVVAAFELGRRFFAKKAGKPVFIRNAAAAHEHLKGIAHLNKEQIRGLYLNSRRELVYEEIISVGSMTASVIHPREVFLPAVTHGAAAVIVAHNHPSGDPNPTEADLEVTKQLVQAGDVMGISVIDHLIVVDSGFNSIINLN